MSYLKWHEAFALVALLLTIPEYLVISKQNGTEINMDHSCSILYS